MSYEECVRLLGDQTIDLPEWSYTREGETLKYPKSSLFLQKSLCFLYFYPNALSKPR